MNTFNLFLPFAFFTFHDLKARESHPRFNLLFLLSVSNFISGTVTVFHGTGL